MHIEPRLRPGLHPCEAGIREIPRSSDVEKPRHAGSRPKKKEGILLAIHELLKSDPEMDAGAVWSNLEEYAVPERYLLWTDDDVLVQQDLKTQNLQRIKYNTFVRHYYRPTKKRLKDAIGQ